MQKKISFVLLLAVLCTPQISFAQPDALKEFARRTKKITLKNGMRVLIYERPESPTVSFSMFIRTGGIDDDSGKSGLAHMFEHMLFKGTKTIGTTDYGKESVLMDRLDAAEADLQREKNKGIAASEERLAELQKKVEELQEKQGELLVEEEYWRIYERAGGQNINASTGFDFTNYVISLPVNQIDLWMAMESDRIRNPVLREFYKERSVVLEERRLRVDNSPNGKLWEGFLAAAYMAHPYGRPIVGWESDISRVTRADAEKFFRQHYDISRLVLGVAGGVKAEKMEALIRDHFEKIPSNPSKEVHNIPIEPQQQGERRVVIEYDAEPSMLIGYHRPDMMDKDNAALDVMASILSEGRTSRFYKTIIEKKRIGVSAWANSSAPGERAPSLIILGGSPRAPHTAAELEQALYEQVEELRKNGPTQAELEKVKNKWEAGFIRNLDANDGLADQLAYYESVAGDWQWLLRQVEAVRAVTAADVKRVITTYMTPSNRTVAVLTRKK